MANGKSPHQETNHRNEVKLSGLQIDHINKGDTVRWAFESVIEEAFDKRVKWCEELIEWFFVIRFTLCLLVRKLIWFSFKIVKSIFPIES